MDADHQTKMSAGKGFPGKYKFIEHRIQNKIEFV